MTEPQPEYVWVFPPEKSRAGRLWAIIILAVLAIGLAVAIFLLFLRPWEKPAPQPTQTTVASATPSDTPSPTPSVTPSQTPVPTATATPPVTTPPQPPVADPTLGVFRDKVQPRLADAATGLGYAHDSSPEEGVQLMDQLRNDAGWLSDAVPPSSIADQWNSRVAAYGKSLDSLRAAFETGATTAGPLAAAESALQALNELVAG